MVCIFERQIENCLASTVAPPQQREGGFTDRQRQRQQLAGGGRHGAQLARGGVRARLRGRAHAWARGGARRGAAAGGGTGGRRRPELGKKGANLVVFRCIDLR